MRSECHMWWEKKNKTEHLLDVTVSPRRQVLLLQPQQEVLTGFCLRCFFPLCDWWVSFYQLMAKPPLTPFTFLFVAVSVCDCHRFILIRDLLLSDFVLRLACRRVHGLRLGKWPAALFTFTHLFTKCRVLKLLKGQRSSVWTMERIW